MSTLREAELSKLTGEVVTAVTNIGEIIGRLKTFDDDVIVIENPRVFLAQGEQAGLAPTIAGTAEHEPGTAFFNHEWVATVVKASDQIVEHWRQVTSGIQIASANDPR